MQRIVFCWTGLTGYMPACWRALMALPDIEVRVYIEKRSVATQHDFQIESLRDIPHRVRSREDGADVSAWIGEIAAFRPQLIEATGWFSRLSQAVAWSPQLADTPKVMGLDLPYRGTLRQRLAPVVLRRYLKRFRAVCVPGERAAVYAQHLGFSDQQIERPLYGFDWQAFAEGKGHRARGPWPRRFLFAGRYCRDKGVDTLIEAYRRYRERASDPWLLDCCGKGEDAPLLQGVEGVSDLGFCPPEQMSRLMAQHGTFILPSRREPWGVALGEACASGLPVIASTACGAAVELVRPGFNGLLCEPDDPDSLCAAMLWAQNHAEELPCFGARGSRLAEPYSASAWASCWRDMVDRWGTVR